MATEVKVGDNLVRITDGIYTTLRCTNCGKNLPLMTWDCPNCNPTVTAENVHVSLKTLHIALGSYSFSPKDIARMSIVKAVRDGLTMEDQWKLEEYENRENPCEEER